MQKTINDYRTEATLNKKFRYSEGVMTRREWLNMWRIKGATVEEKNKNRIEYNRIKFNRLEGVAQDEYWAKCNEKVPGWRLNLPDGSFFDIGKTEYDYFNNMELAEDKATEANELNNKIEAGTSTPEEEEQAMQKEFEFAAKYF